MAVRNKQAKAIISPLGQPASFWILQQTKEYPKICYQQAKHNLLSKQNKTNPDNNGF
jgi:hypothetical protein